MTMAVIKMAIPIAKNRDGNHSMSLLSDIFPLPRQPRRPTQTRRLAARRVERGLGFIGFSGFGVFMVKGLGIGHYQVRVFGVWGFPGSWMSCLIGGSLLHFVGYR